MPIKLPIKLKPKKKKKPTGPKRAANGARKLREPKYKSFKLSKRLKSTRPKLPSSIQILRMSFALLKKHWFIFSSITIIYLIISIILVKGLGNTIDITGIRDSASELFEGNWGKFVSGFTVIAALFGNTTSPASDAAGAYQTTLLILFSLVFIWALRQLHAGEVIGVRDAFYKGMYPLVPFVLVLLVIVIQMLPSVMVGYMYQLVFVQGLAVTALERVLWALLMALLILWTLYMVTSSIFALYISTLPDMRPMQALRSARELVRHRRWSMMLKVLFLPIAIFLLMVGIMYPIVSLLPLLAEWIFYIMTLASLAITHAYMYVLYRELIK